MRFLTWIAARVQRVLQVLRRHLVQIAIIVLAAVAVAIGVLIIISNGSDGFSWTGFKGKTLWEWLGLLAVFAIPIVVGFGATWFTEAQRRAERDQEKRIEQKALIRKLYSDIIQAYNAAKGVRRILRGSTRSRPRGNDMIMITIESYDKQMQALVGIQLQFESFIAEITSNPTFSENIRKDTKGSKLKRINSWQDIIAPHLKNVEDYLNGIIEEYEKLNEKRQDATPTLPISKLAELEGFIGEKSKANTFFKSSRQVKAALLHELLAPDKEYSPDPPVNEAAQTLSEFCHLVQAYDFGSAYKLYSDNLKSQFTATQFHTFWNMLLSDCTINITSSSDTNVTGSIAATEPNTSKVLSYNVTFVEDRNGFCKIDTVRPQ